MNGHDVRRKEQTEPWDNDAAPDAAEDSKELTAMNEAELDAEMEEELSPVGHWMQENSGAAEFANALYPDLLDIDEAKQALPVPDGGER